MTTYRAFKETDAIQFALGIPNLFRSNSQLICREIGDGNLNLVFHISDPDNHKSIILKQALPYAKVVGESWPLTLDRARIESEALRIQSGLCPDLVPQVFAYDSALALTVMEDLSDHKIMRTGLIDGIKYPLFPQHIGTFLAHTLFYTSDLGMNQQDKKLQAQQFTNPELCKITEDLIFDHPYTDADTNSFDDQIREAVETVWNDSVLHLEVALLREKFLTQSQALLHGDLHTGSIFVTQKSTKVIDPEFAFYGPMGFDIGAVLANLLLNFAGQQYWSKDDSLREDYRLYLLITIEEIWNHFHQQLNELWDTQVKDRMANTPGYRNIYIKRIFQDSIGYAGCKMIRRIIGLAHAADLSQIPDQDIKGRAERIALAIGKLLVKQNRNISTIREVQEMANMSLTEE